MRWLAVALLPVVTAVLPTYNLGYLYSEENSSWLSESVRQQGNIINK